MGWSRLRNGMHYPSDILAGIILGILYGYLALAILKIV
jgi:membrane-associated phospholipid phosphatase